MMYALFAGVHSDTAVGRVASQAALVVRTDFRKSALGRRCLHKSVSRYPGGTSRRLDRPAAASHPEAVL